MSVFFCQSTPPHIGTGTYHIAEYPGLGNKPVVRISVSPCDMHYLGAQCNRNCHNTLFFEPWEGGAPDGVRR